MTPTKSEKQRRIKEILAEKGLERHMSEEELQGKGFVKFNFPKIEDQRKVHAVGWGMEYGDGVTVVYKRETDSNQQDFEVHAIYPIRLL